MQRAAGFVSEQADGPSGPLGARLGDVPRSPCREGFLPGAGEGSVEDVQASEPPGPASMLGAPSTGSCP